MSNEQKDKKVVIIGIDSFTGRHLYNAIKSDFKSVTGTSRSATSKWSYLDLLDKDSIKEFLIKEKPDMVVLLAAISNTTGVPQQKYFDVNYLGIINFIEAARNVNALFTRVIYASTSHVYGLAESNCIDEQQPLAVQSYYAFSKLASENALRIAFPENLVIVRPFNYTGVGQPVDFLIPKLIKNFVNRASVIRLGNLYPIRDYNDVRNVCCIYRNILLSNIGATTLNICSGVGLTIMELLSKLEDISGHTIDVNIDPALIRDGEPKIQIGSTSRLIELGLYNHTFTICDTLNDLYQQQVENFDY